MPKVKIPFYKDGAEFEPEVYLEDIEEYDAREEEAGKGRTSAGMLHARRDFLLKVLSRHNGAPVTLADMKPRPRTQDLQAAWLAVWRAAFSTDAPLA